MISVAFSICSFIYIIIFASVYFSKTRIDLLENKIYTRLLITTIIGLAIDIIGYFSFQDGIIDSGKNILIAKIYLIYYFTWTFLLTIYTFIVSTKAKKKIDYEKLIKKLTKIYIPLTIIILLLPINIKIAKHSLYSYGPSVNLVYTLSGILIAIMLISILSNAKNIKRKEYIPLLVFILFGTIVMIIQRVYPELLLLITCHSMVAALMYFTIENPDMQMVEELNKNRKLTEQNFEEKSNFLFKISQDLKKPLLDITNISSNMIETTKGETQEQAQIINNNSKQLYTYVNNALDVSNMDIKNLKIIENTYNTENFFKEIILRIKSEIQTQNKNIEFRYNITKNIPLTLKGDNTKIKQVILSVMQDSIEYTNTGFVELTVNTIIKYGICRLIIEISDSGTGMSIEKINEILGTTGELTKEELERIDTPNINLPLAHKIIKTINGNFIIKSEINQGTNFLIIVDQKIEEEKKSKITKQLEKYTKNISRDSILLVTQDKKIINKIKKIMDENEIETTVSLFGKDAVEHTKKENYKCIIIDDELTNESGIDILKQIKTKTQCFILLSKGKEFMAKHYIEDGFKNYIIKEKIEEELNKTGLIQ